MKLIMIIVMLLLGVAAFSQKNLNDSNNYKLAIEALNNKNYEEAAQYLDKEVEVNPKNANAWFLLAIYNQARQEYGKAIEDINKAIKYCSDKEGMHTAYKVRAALYTDIEDTEKALDDYATALKFSEDEDEIYTIYCFRASIYYNQGKYDIAQAECQRMIDLIPEREDAYRILATVYLMQGKPDEVINQVNYAIKLKGEGDELLFETRARAYLDKEMWDEATDDFITTLDYKCSQTLLYTAIELNETAFSMFIQKLKAMMAINQTDPYWPSIISYLYSEKKQYEKAVEYYKITLSLDRSIDSYTDLALCLYNMAQYNDALININKALDIDSINTSLLAIKANILRDLGDLTSSIATSDKALEIYPNIAPAYVDRATTKMYQGRYEEAIEDLNLAIAHDYGRGETYLLRADAYMKLGDKAHAEADYNEALWQLTFEYDHTFSECFAYQGLGKNEEAIETLNKIMATNTTDSVYYYCAAQLYSRMHDKENALKYLQRAFELGYRNFVHISYDFNMEFIRETDEFKSLIDKYKKINTLGVA